jgi:signal transduction histidine kinase
MNREQMIRASWGRWLSQSAAPVGPWWIQYVWTFCFAVVVAACFTIAAFLMFAHREPGGWSLADWRDQYLASLLISLLIAYAIQLFFKLARRLLGQARIRRMSTWQRWLFYSGIPVAGVLFGNVAGALLLGDRVQMGWSSGDPDARLGTLLFAGLSWFLFWIYFSARTQKILAERRATEAQLQLLQAQMEPHFLFNTLANVVGLMESDTPRAKAMLESFTDYLRASLLSLRSSEHSLAAELALIEAYLKVVKVRMEDRLHYRIDVPVALRSMRVPALSLQPLVENAVIHGLEPNIDGGLVTIVAVMRGGSLVISVCDDGLGLQAARPSGHRGSGTALANIRERLRQTHGDRANLSIDPAPPHGVCATVTLPSEPAP